MYSVYPTLVVCAYYGIKIPVKLKLGVEKLQLATKYSFVINLTYWSTFLVISSLMYSIREVHIIVASVAFLLGLIIWPFTIGVLTVSIVNTINKKYP